MKELLTGFHHIGLPTTDMDGTIKFYESLGGQVVMEKDDVDEGRPIRVVHILLSTLKLELFERLESAGVPGAFDHIAIEVSDVDAAYAKCKAMGMRFMVDGVSSSTYWPPENLRWFIVYGVNGEKVEFAQKG